MATHDRPELERSVDDRMGRTAPNPDHQPDVNGALAVPTPPHAGRRKSIGSWVVAAAVIVWLGVLLFTVGPGRETHQPEDIGARAHGRDVTVTEDAGAGVALSAPRRSSEPRLISMAQREAAPGFSLPDMDGRTATLGDYTGQVLLLNFWATWCQPCRAEMPWFVEFQADFGHEGFAVLGVSVDEPGWDIVRPFLERYPVNYRIALADTADKLVGFGPMNVLPTTWLIDRDGRVAAKHVGLVSRAGIASEIRRLLDAIRK